MLFFVGFYTQNSWLKLVSRQMSVWCIFWRMRKKNASGHNEAMQKLCLTLNSCSMSVARLINVVTDKTQLHHIAFELKAYIIYYGSKNPFTKCDIVELSSIMPKVIRFNYAKASVVITPVEVAHGTVPVLLFFCGKIADLTFYFHCLPSIMMINDLHFVRYFYINFIVQASQIILNQTH